MKVPKFKWIPFDKDNPPDIPVSVNGETRYLIFFREAYLFAGYNGYKYHTDIATPNGSYLGNFWNTSNDWIWGGNRIEVLAYAEIPCYMNETDLMEV